MSKPYEDTVTLEIDGIEADFDVRCNVETEMCGSGMRAFFDGTPEVHMGGGRWEPIDELDLSAAHRERVLDALGDCALTDDEDQCDDRDDYVSEIDIAS